MRFVASCLLVLCLLTVVPGCWSGPWRLSQSWHDNTQEWYSHNAWLHGALLGDIIPVYPIVQIVLAFVDVLFVNPWYFWSHDAWTNDGTAFVHRQPTGPATVGSAFGDYGGGSQQGGWAPGKK